MHPILFQIELRGEHDDHTDRRTDRAAAVGHHALEDVVGNEVLTGAQFDRNFRSGEKFGEPNLEEKEMEFLYKDGTSFCFMNSANFEQEFVGEAQVGEAKNFLKENTVCTVLFYQDRPISITIPIFMNLRIVKSDPWVKGDTASGDSKPATLETGYVLQVPSYIEEGTLIKVDTRTGSYVERVKE